MLSLNAPKACRPRAASQRPRAAAAAPVSRRSAVVVLAHGPHGATKVLPTGEASAKRGQAVRFVRGSCLTPRRGRRLRPGDAHGGHEAAHQGPGAQGGRRGRAQAAASGAHLHRQQAPPASCAAPGRPRCARLAPDRCTDAADRAADAQLRASQWTPTLKGYLAFLNESKAVYETFESIMADGRHPECEPPAGGCPRRPPWRPAGPPACRALPPCL
jgi:hypothetical protein